MSLTGQEVMILAKDLSVSGSLRNLDTLSRPRWSLGLQVLLVEDDEADAYLIRRALAKNPWVAEVVLAEDGVEALELLDKGRVSPDLAIVDLHMPRKDGLVLLRDFATRVSAQFPSVMLTSSKSSKDALRATKRGAVEFITKPKTERQLAVALNRAIHDAFQKQPSAGRPPRPPGTDV
jgi:CheY-like chemotaxis protein